MKMKRKPFESNVGDVGVADVQVLDIGAQDEHGAQHLAAQVQASGQDQLLDTVADSW